MRQHEYNLFLSLAMLKSPSILCLKVWERAGVLILVCMQPWNTMSSKNLWITASETHHLDQLGGKEVEWGGLHILQPMYTNGILKDLKLLWFKQPMILMIFTICRNILQLMFTWSYVTYNHWNWWYLWYFASQASCAPHTPQMCKKLHICGVWGAQDLAQALRHPDTTDV